MYMNYLKIFTLSTAFFMLATTCFSGAGTTALPYLTSPAGARAIGLSGATGGLVDGAYSLFSNPAGLALMENGEGSFSHQIGIAQVSTEIISLAYPIPKKATIGLGILYRGQPDIDNVPGEPAIQVNDLVIHLAGAGKMNKEFNIGGNIKYIQSTLGEYSASAFAVDFGTQYTVAKTMHFGLAIQNLGTGIKYLSYSAVLPTTLKASWATNQSLGNQHTLVAGIDLNYGLGDAIFSANTGAEYTFAQLASIRLGYAIGQESLDSISTGVGIRYAISGLVYRLDYAFAPKLWNGFAQSEAEHTITLSVGF